MRKAYLAISYTNRILFNKEVNSLIELCKTFDIELLAFVDKYNFKSHQENEMVETAFSEIDKSDLVIAELTTKSIGVGIEIGYANAKGKPIIYIRKSDSEYSTTASGCMTYILEYENESDLSESIKKILEQLN